MTTEGGIYYGSFDGFTWIRCEGKGSFLQSPAMKDCANRRCEAGERHFVIDLEDCSGMDSTFMGFLAGLASRVRGSGGSVAIASPGERNRQSLEDLGLGCLVEIDPPEASWRGRVAEIRGRLEPFRRKSLPDLEERARHVLDAHKNLAATSEENAKRFAGVIEGLSPKESGGADGSGSRR